MAQMTPNGQKWIFFVFCHSVELDVKAVDIKLVKIFTNKEYGSNDSKWPQVDFGNFFFAFIHYVDLDVKAVDI